MFKKDILKGVDKPGEILTFTTKSSGRYGSISVATPKDPRGMFTNAHSLRSGWRRREIMSLHIPDKDDTRLYTYAKPSDPESKYWLGKKVKLKSSTMFVSLESQTVQVINDGSSIFIGFWVTIEARYWDTFTVEFK